MRPEPPLDTISRLACAKAAQVTYADRDGIYEWEVEAPTGETFVVSSILAAHANGLAAATLESLPSQGTP